MLVFTCYGLCLDHVYLFCVIVVYYFYMDVLNLLSVSVQFLFLLRAQCCTSPLMRSMPPLSRLLAGVLLNEPVPQEPEAGGDVPREVVDVLQQTEQRTLD